MEYDYIVIGAGAAGLMASTELTKAGKRVLLLEARDRIGGRIHTFQGQGFIKASEAGAEFIHGDLPLTTALLQSASIYLQPMEGETYQILNGNMQNHDFLDDEWNAIIKELKKLKTDVTFEQFLEQKFPIEKHRPLHESIKKFVEGYNAADSRKASALALREEWLQDEDPIQYRPEAGYGKLTEFLLSRCIEQGLELQLSEIVTRIQWDAHNVIVKTKTEHFYSAKKVLITVPLGVLQAERIQFEPSIPTYTNAVKNIGFGSVIKFLFQFKDAFWQNNLSRKMPGLKFLFTDAPIPTWWSQLPDNTPMLTGWLGGPQAENLDEDKEQLFSIAISSLSYAFECPASFIQERLSAFHICNWKADPFCFGAYSYATVETPSAKKLLNTPIGNTLYFAGEALYNGPHTGTVEAALSSGKDAARKILHTI